MDNAEKCFPLASHPIMSREDYKPPAGTALWWGNGEEMVHQVGSVPPTHPQHPTELLTVETAGQALCASLTWAFLSPRAGDSRD